MPILDGVTVIEIGQVIAAPYAAVILAGLGARVIKVERPDPEDRRALTYQSFNHDKESVTLDLTTAEGLGALHGLLAEADILIHNLRAGVPEALGLDPATLVPRYPRLIYCELSAFGNAGPLQFSPGYEAIVQAFSGLSSINGGPDDPPIRLGISACDLGTGMWGVIGVLAMLDRQRRTGQGGVVSCSLLETALSWSAQKTDAWINDGALPDRHASGHSQVVPYQAFDASDGPFLVCCANDRLFAKLAAALERPEWVESPDYATNKQRVLNKGVLLAELARIFGAEPRATWIELFRAAGVPCGPINSIPEALAEPQVATAGMVQTVPGSTTQLTGLPISFDGQRPAIVVPARRD